jgi:hypothetical protein
VSECERVEKVVLLRNFRFKKELGKEENIEISKVSSLRYITLLCCPQELLLFSIHLYQFQLLVCVCVSVLSRHQSHITVHHLPIILYTM